MKTAIILGTRPEIIKMSPIIKLLQETGADFFVLHTGQHYSYDFDRVFFEQLELPMPAYNLGVGSGSHAEETGRMLIGIEAKLQEQRPDIVLVEGDTNSVLAGALAASKLGIKIGHVEAGLRSSDRTMPEEINRILTDHISDYLFAPTATAQQYLAREGIPPENVYVTGNTIVDAVYQNLALAKAKVDPVRELGLRPGEYFLVTMHRQENVDREDRLSSMLDGLSRLSCRYGQPIVYPIHHRTRQRMEKFGLHAEGVTVTDPMDYLRFLRLEKEARLILTDSGGVQEEACILGVPCVTLRDNTERPETVEVGANMLAGASPENMLTCVETMLSRQPEWTNPFGDGTASRTIIDIIGETMDG